MLSRTKIVAISLLVVVFTCLLWLAPIPTTSSQSGPSITTLSPSTVRAGESGFTVDVTGSGFTSGAVVRFNGSDRSTTFISATTLSASIPATDTAIVGTFPITVRNPNGSTSSASNLTVTPSVTNLSPMTAAVNSPTLTLTIEGAGFVNGSTVRWDGSSRTTTFISAKKLTASISASDLDTLDIFPVTVRNPSPNTLTSNAINFRVTNVPPATECPAGADVTLADPGMINSGPARSQMWRNGNIWWGAFSNNSDGIYFYKQTSPATWVQGALIDTNMVAGTFIAGSPDCLWNGTNLFVLIQESALLAKLYKYTYSSASETYSLVSGFPVNLPLSGIGTTSSGKIYPNIALDQDGTGKLWAAYNGGGIGGDGNVRVIYSTSSDHRTWSTSGFVLATGVSITNTEGTAILRFGGNRIGVGWSSHPTSELAFRYHTDGQSSSSWSTKEVIDSGPGPEGTGDVAGKQLSMKAAPDGRIFLATDDNDGLNNHLHLYIRTTGGTWGSKTLVVNSFSAIPSKPVLLLDTDNSIVHVIYKDNIVAANGLSGQTFITQASMNNPTFNTPCLILDTSDDDIGLSTSNPTSTKQNLTATTDLVVAGSTGRNGNRILVNTVDLTPSAVTIFNISPKEVTAGESGFTLTVNGKLFNSNSVVRFNGLTRTTTFANATRLTASITSADIASPNSYPITVRNSNPTVDSNAKNLVVSATNPLPTLSTISPKRELAGTSQFTMTLTGAGFRRSSVVSFNGSNRATQFVSDVQLTATIPASDLLVPGSYPVTVFNPTPGGGISTVTPITNFYVMPICSAPVGQTLPGITLFNTVKSQMWYNDSLWWGAFSDNLGGVYFYKQNGSTFTKGALLESNFNGRPDVLWNGTHLFVLVYENNTLAKLYKYTYNTVTDTYALISGFPVNLPLIGIGPGVSAAETGSVTIAQDSMGKLWAAYPGSFIAGDGNYRVIWSTSADHKTWNTTGYIFDTGADVGTQEVAPIVHYGGDKIGIVYSKQPTKEILFRHHVDGDPETTWSTTEIVDSGNGHIGVGGVADNHMSLKAAPDGRLFVVAKDSDAPAGYINLYVRTAAGAWSDPVLVDVDPHAMVTRPVLVLDVENSDAYVFYGEANSGFMFMNKSPMNNPVFGPACPHFNVIGVSDPTTTKQNLKASMGLRTVGSTGGVTSSLHFNPLTLAAGSGNVPVLNNISPTAAGLDGGPFTLTVNGTNFATNAIVYFNGSDRPTTFVSPTQLTARIMASDVGAMGSYPITVMNPKGGTSAAVNLTISVISSLSPESAVAGSPAFTLIVNGSGFVSGATVRYNNSNRTTTFVNSNQLTAQITASDVATVGIRSVTVNQSGTTSPPSNFTVTNPAPVISTISPTGVTMGGNSTTLTVNGTGFTSGSVVNFNLLPRTTTFVNSTQLTAQITTTDRANKGLIPITVANPTPGGGVSNAVELAINNIVPTLTSISPTTKTAGDAAFTLTVNGTNYNSSSIVQFNGADRPTTLVNSTRVTAQLSAVDVAAGGTFPIRVFNPPPGGGSTSTINLSVSNLPPTLSSISPTSMTAGQAASTLTVTGNNYNGSSIVRFNGSNRPTTLVSTTQLTTQLTAADLAATGTFTISVFNPAPSGGTSGVINLAVVNPVPEVTTLAPNPILEGSSAFTLIVNGTNFNGGSLLRWNGQPRTTSLVSSTQLTALIDAADVASAGTVSVTVNNPAPGGGTSDVVTFTIDPNPRVVSATNGSAAANSIVTIHIQLMAQGDENALGFTLNFDPALLSNPEATLGADAAGASLNINSSQVALGRYSLALSLPSGQSFVAGTREIVTVTFTTAAVGTETVTQVGFGDQPLVREIANSVAEPLPTAYTSGTVTITLGYEADVAPRPTGSNNGTVSIGDWTQMGRFFSGLEEPTLGSEFQRTDCAPLSSLGDGRISIADWTQAGRYAAGLDPVVPAGGPTGPLPPEAPVTFNAQAAKSSNSVELAIASTTVNLVSEGLRAGQSMVSIEFDAQGNENAFGFSLMFDPAKMSFVSAEKSNEASSATLNVNQLEADKGRIGIALAQPAGRNFAAGRHQLVVLTFTARADTSETPTIGFADLPIAREVVDLNANPMNAVFKDAAGVNPIEDAQFFVTQHYLDFLNRAPDTGGLDYWTRQITYCGTDAACVRQRRSAVSAAFFIEQEFQQTSFAVYRLYRAAYGRPPTYAEFIAARNQLSGGAQLPASTLGFANLFANQFVSAPEFQQSYPGSLTATQFINKLYETAGLGQSTTDKLRAVQDMKTQGKSHAKVLLDLIDTKGFKEREYNPAFVLMQYFGYLKRDPDQGGFEFWLNILNKEQGNYRGMVCSFITSREYQERFGALAPRSNQECGLQGRKDADLDGLLWHLHANLFRPRTYTVPLVTRDRLGI